MGVNPSEVPSPSLRGGENKQSRSAEGAPVEKGSRLGGDLGELGLREGPQEG